MIFFFPKLKSPWLGKRKEKKGRRKRLDNSFSLPDLGLQIVTTKIYFKCEKYTSREFEKIKSPNVCTQHTHNTPLCLPLSVTHTHTQENMHFKSPHHSVLSYFFSRLLHISNTRDHDSPACLKKNSKKNYLLVQTSK